MRGEEYLRDLADEIVAAGDLNWWARYSAAFDALDFVGAVDTEVATTIGEEIRAGLTRRTGEQVPGFLLGRRRGPGDLSRRFASGHFPQPGPWPPVVSVRSAAATLPVALGVGGTMFVTQVDDGSFLVCGGAGEVPWPRREHRPPPPGSSGWLTSTTGPPMKSTEEAMFSAIFDDRGRAYRLDRLSRSATSSGSERQRWYLRSKLSPAVPDDVVWLRFETGHGPMTATLGSPVATATATSWREPAQLAVEQYLDAKLHAQVWRHLLNPAGHLAPLETVLSALTAVDAVPATHPLVAMGRAVDTAISGGDVTAEVPEVLRAALAANGPRPAWQGVAALEVFVDHPDGPRLVLEAAVGFGDRLAVEFLEPAAYPGSTGPRAADLVVTATDSEGGGYVGHAEGGSPGDGVLHLRPALNPRATNVTLRLDGPTAAVTVIFSVPPEADGPASGAEAVAGR